MVQVVKNPVGGPIAMHSSSSTELKGPRILSAEPAPSTKKDSSETVNKSQEGLADRTADDLKGLVIVEYQEFSCLTKGLGLAANITMIVSITVTAMQTIGSRTCVHCRKPVLFAGRAGDRRVFQRTEWRVQPHGRI